MPGEGINLLAFRNIVSILLPSVQSLFFLLWLQNATQLSNMCRHVEAHIFSMHFSRSGDVCVPANKCLSLVNTSIQPMTVLLGIWMIDICTVFYSVYVFTMHPLPPQREEQSCVLIQEAPFSLLPLSVMNCMGQTQTGCPISAAWTSRKHVLCVHGFVWRLRHDNASRTPAGPDREEDR